MFITILLFALVTLSSGKRGGPMLWSADHLSWIDSGTLKRDIMPILNTKIDGTIKSVGLDPYPSMWDEPILQIFNLTGLSKLKITKIAANSVATLGKSNDAEITIEGKCCGAGGLKANGYFGSGPKRVAVAVEASGLDFKAAPVKALAVGELMNFSITAFTVFKVDVTYHEVKFTSSDTPLQEVLNNIMKVHSDYRETMEDTLTTKVKYEIDKSIQAELPARIMAGTQDIKQNSATNNVSTETPAETSTTQTEASTGTTPGTNAAEDNEESSATSSISTSASPETSSETSPEAASLAILTTATTLPEGTPPVETDEGTTDAEETKQDVTDQDTTGDEETKQDVPVSDNATVSPGDTAAGSDVLMQMVGEEAEGGDHWAARKLHDYDGAAAAGRLRGYDGAAATRGNDVDAAAARGHDAKTSPHHHHHDARKRRFMHRKAEGGSALHA